MATTIKVYFRKKLIRDFFVSQFSGSASGVVKVTRSNDIGRYVYSMLKYSDLPVNKPMKGVEDWHQVTISLPEAKFLFDQSRFVYIAVEEIYKLNDYAIAVFNLQFKSFMLMGTDLRMDIKNVIDLFMVMYGIDQDSADALVKKDYRSRVALKEKVVRLAQELGYV